MAPFLALGARLAPSLPPLLEARRNLSFILLREMEGGLESTRRPCPFPPLIWKTVYNFRSTDKTDFRLQRPGHAGMRCAHGVPGSALGPTLEHRSPSSPLPGGRGGRVQQGVASRVVLCQSCASLFTYLEPHRGSGKGNLLSRFLRRDHICSRRKPVRSGIWLQKRRLASARPLAG